MRKLGVHLDLPQTSRANTVKWQSAHNQRGYRFNSNFRKNTFSPVFSRLSRRVKLENTPLTITFKAFEPPKCPSVTYYHCWNYVARGRLPRAHLHGSSRVPVQRLTSPSSYQGHSLGWIFSMDPHAMFFQKSSVQILPSGRLRKPPPWGFTTRSSQNCAALRASQVPKEFAGIPAFSHEFRWFHW